MDLGILSFGGYLPKARLQRAEIARTHAWFNPALMALAKGERTMANWDEDSVTMAVEAGRDCLTGIDRSIVAGAYMASTSFPFQDRQNAGIVADALNLNSGIQTIDLSSSQRAGSSSLMVALQATRSNGPVLVTASEKRRTKAASSLELTTGDGAAALLVGEGEVAARLLGGHTESVDFVDHYRGQGESYDYTWEERWIRDEGYMKIVPAAVGTLLKKVGVQAADITTFCFPTAMRRVAGGLATRLGLADDVVADNLQDRCGETGTAHPLVLLVHALETARPGERILVAGFGQGCDALLFEVTDAIDQVAGRIGISGHLARGREESRYSRFLAFNDLMSMERGIRAEVDKQTGLSTLYRNKEMTQELMGGHCTACGTKQFPKSRICVNPECGETGTQKGEPFADKPAQLNSFTADRLIYSPDPPMYFGMVQFEGGGRLMSDFTDIDPDGRLEVGMPMKMVFRVKDYDTQRGFRRYFWKATPTDGDH
jgi:3-hydroxy-3-methylglutaryl CoA synthase